ncbi:MAG: hypothetical protein ACK2U3_12985 [Anaerolineales bacterium]|jgi:hypothetical protein
MPQLVKGGKYIFGWTLVDKNGRISLPPMAEKEYRFDNLNRLIMLPGSKTSGGFGLYSPQKILRSRIGSIFRAHPEFMNFKTAPGKIINFLGTQFCWVKFSQSIISIPVETLGKFGVRAGAKLLVARGSKLGMAFVMKGPIITEARKHSELQLFTPDSIINKI